jgi:hypothetical protein
LRHQLDATHGLRTATTRIIRTQAEERLASRLHVSREAGGMPDGDMDVTEVVLEPILAIDGVGPGRMEDKVEGTVRLVHGARDRTPRLHDGRIEIALTPACARP